jgi:hypothetical protein
MKKAKKPAVKKKRKTKTAPKRDFAQIAFDAVRKVTGGHQ